MRPHVEYFVAKSVTPANVPLETWNRLHHDHAAEIAGGRVKVLDATGAETKQIVEIASKTDGIVFSLWQPAGAKAPLGEVKHPQAVGHVPMTLLIERRHDLCPRSLLRRARRGFPNESWRGISAGPRNAGAS